MCVWGGNVSAVLQNKLPPKCKDQGMFAISCKISNVKNYRAMCNLGASINVMPLSIYNFLNVEPLKKCDHTTSQPVCSTSKRGS